MYSVNKYTIKSPKLFFVLGERAIFDLVWIGNTIFIKLD